MPEYNVSGTRQVEDEERQFEAPVLFQPDEGEDADPVEKQVRDAFLDDVEKPDQFSDIEVQ